MILAEVMISVCSLYLICIGLFGIVFVIHMILESPKIPVEKRIPLVFVAAAVFIIFKPLAELFAGSYAIALFHTNLQMKRRMRK